MVRRNIHQWVEARKTEQDEGSPKSPRPLRDDLLRPRKARGPGPQSWEPSGSGLD